VVALLSWPPLAALAPEPVASEPIAPGLVASVLVRMTKLVPYALDVLPPGELYEVIAVDGQS